MIEVQHLEKIYYRGDGTPVKALSDVSFSIAGGEFVTIRGKSGSGKSSLLNILGCLDTPTAGKYLLAGQDVSGYDDLQRSQARSEHLGFVFQSFNLLPRTTAVENVEMPALYGNHTINRDKAMALLERVGLGDRAQHFVSELSGGEQQRVAIARALMNDAPVLLADEPTGNLDSAAGDAVMELLTELHKEGRTILIVTHDEATAAYADRELVIADGVIASDRKQSRVHAATGAAS